MVQAISVPLAINSSQSRPVPRLCDDHRHDNDNNDDDNDDDDKEDVVTAARCPTSNDSTVGKPLD